MLVVIVMMSTMTIATGCNHTPCPRFHAQNNYTPHNDTAKCNRNQTLHQSSMKKKKKMEETKKNENKLKFAKKRKANDDDNERTK